MQTLFFWGLTGYGKNLTEEYKNALIALVYLTYMGCKLVLFFETTPNRKAKKKGEM